MTDQDVRDFLARMAVEESFPFSDAEVLTRRARHRAARTIAVGALGVAVGIAGLFAGASELREPSPNMPVIEPTPTPTAVVQSAAREVLWYPEEDGPLLAVDTLTGQERVLVDATSSFEFRRAALSADGRWAAYETWEGESPALYVVGPEGETRKVVQLSDTHLATWAWSATGALLAVNRVTHLDVIDPATGRVSELGSTFNVDAPPAWSPDGARILLGATGGMLYSVDTSTGEVSVLVQLPDDLASTTAIAWSPDGSRVAVYSELRPEGEEQFPFVGRLFVMDADGSNVRVLAEGEFFPGFDWSPDGTRLTFAESLNRSSRVWIAPTDGSTASVVETSAFRFANPGSTWGLPAWSPEGTQVAFSGEPNNAFVIDADGSGRAKPIDDLTYASWNGGSFCGMCLWWINHPVSYLGS